MKKLLTFLREKLFLINDSPHKIALGAALGVFAGIFPGMGPMASIFLAIVFRANRAAALAGSLLTNTWLSIVIFAVSLQAGAWVLGVDWQQIYGQAQGLMQDFHWREIFSGPVLAIMKPLLVGYVLTGAFLGIVTYGVVWGGIWLRRRNQEKLSQKS